MGWLGMSLENLGSVGAGSNMYWGQATEIGVSSCQ